MTVPNQHTRLNFLRIMMRNYYLVAERTVCFFHLHSRYLNIECLPAYTYLYL